MTALASRPVWLIGGGGHGKVVVAALRAAGMRAAGIFDSDPETWGRRVLDVPVVGDLPTPAWWGREACLGFLAIGANHVRQKLARVHAPLDWPVVIHPRATVDDDAQIGEGTLVSAGAVIQPGATVGSHVVINTGGVVEHDVRVGAFAFVAPGACLAGGVTIGEGTFIGVNASVLPGVSIGAWSTVGAGAVVIDDLPPNVTAVGVPARPISSNRG